MRPSVRQIRNVGMRVIIPGNIMVPNMMMNKTLRPGKRKRAKPYATMAQVRISPPIANTVVKIVFKKNWVSG